MKYSGAKVSVTNNESTDQVRISAWEVGVLLTLLHTLPVRLLDQWACGENSGI